MLIFLFVMCRKGVKSVLDAKMQACSGAAVRGSVQQPIWTKGSNFLPKGSSVVGFRHHVKLNSVKPCRSSRIEGSLVTGRPPSSVSMPEIGGSILYNEFLKKCTLFFVYYVR
jgi:hypothetical protein